MPSIGGAFASVIGTARAHDVVLEFPSYDAALACYRSPEYQDAARLLEASGEVDLVIADGCAGAQP